ncbi:acylphosphatase [Haloimpatiens sp. FM7330]|uniref:acylphosphatase n=1 Tax=Haloimpatiens sp. FM7330 TaxID=3298610 RepID=UPI0036403454
MNRYSIIVHGRVQGVGYRFSTYRTATFLNLTGWVQNLDDGTVKIEVQGSNESIKKFIQRLKHNNKFAKVEYINVKEINKTDNKKSFKIIGY